MRMFDPEVKRKIQKTNYSRKYEGRAKVRQCHWDSSLSFQFTKYQLFGGGSEFEKRLKLFANHCREIGAEQKNS